MTPKEKKWTQLMAWVNNNTCFTGKDVLQPFVESLGIYG